MSFWLTETQWPTLTGATGFHLIVIFNKMPSHPSDLMFTLPTTHVLQAQRDEVNSPTVLGGRARACTGSSFFTQTGPGHPENGGQVGLRT